MQGVLSVQFEGNSNVFFPSHVIMKGELACKFPKICQQIPHVMMMPRQIRNVLQSKQQQLGNSSSRLNQQTAAYF